MKPDSQPRALSAVLDSFDARWSPRIVTSVNDYDVRVAKAEGEHVWHVHEDTDEFFLVTGGELRIALREDGAEREVVLPTGSVFTVPRGVWHRPSAPTGASLLLLEPTGTSTVGDAHDPVPEHVDATTGHVWEDEGEGGAHDESAHQLGSPGNARRVLSSIERLERGGGGRGTGGRAE